jgi:hypothetical protein
MLKLLVNECGLKLSEVRMADQPDYKSIVTAFAPASGSLPLLQYCIEEGCEVDTSVFERAAVFGNLHLLIWLKANYPASAHIPSHLVGSMAHVGQGAVAE